MLANVSCACILPLSPCWLSLMLFVLREGEGTGVQLGDFACGRYAVSLMFLLCQTACNRLHAPTASRGHITTEGYYARSCCQLTDTFEKSSCLNRLKRMAHDGQYDIWSMHCPSCQSTFLSRTLCMSRQFLMCCYRYEECSQIWTQTTDYFQVVGIILGQLTVGFLGDWLGRRWGLIQVIRPLAQTKHLFSTLISISTHTCYVLLTASFQVSVVRQSEHKKWKLRAELMCRGCMLPGVDDSCEVARMNLTGQ